MNTQSRSRHLHHEIELARITWIMIFERNDAFDESSLVKRSFWIVTTSLCSLIIPIITLVTGFNGTWKLRTFFVESNFQITSFFFFLCGPCAKVVRPMYIFTFIGGFRKNKKDFHLPFQIKELLRMEFEKIQKTFLFFFLSCSSISNTNCVIYHEHVCTTTHYTSHTPNTWIPWQWHCQPSASQIICSFYSVNLLSSYQIQCIGEGIAVPVPYIRKPMA